MFRRWWQRHGLSLIFVGVGLSAALFVRQTQGVVIQEFFALIVNGGGAVEEPVEPEILLQNSKLRELQNRVENLEQQNQQLKELLGYRKTTGIEAIAAPVIGRSADAWWQQITIGQGKRAGIKEGDVVTGIGGLVGRVTQVTPNSSRVALLSDVTQKIGVMVSRSRYQGVLKGDNTDPQFAQMSFYEKVPDVKEGDMITTSNLSVLYPQGLPVGKVLKVDYNAGPAPVAQIELSAPLVTLEWVNVIAFEPKELDFELLPEQNVSQNR
jgi:rod shape-determining protein MreC